MLYRFNNFMSKLTVGPLPNLAKGLIKPGMSAEASSTQVFYDSSLKFTKTPSQNEIMLGMGSMAMSSGGGRLPGRCDPSECGPVDPKFKALQERFQVDDDVPVHFKAGMRDKVLYGITLALGVVGLAMGFKFIYVSAFPQKAPREAPSAEE